MKKWIAGPAVAGLLVIGGATAVDASGGAQPMQTEASSDDDGGNAGLWGLLGLAGLAGLAGLKRRRPDHRYEERSPSAGSTARVP